MSRILWIDLEIQFKQRLTLLSKAVEVDSSVAGYLQQIGLTFADPSPPFTEEYIKDFLLQNVVDLLDRDNVILHVAVSEISETDLQKEIFDDPDIVDALESDPRENGIWYKTGRGYFSK